jgi:hypothetical protein
LPLLAKIRLITSEDFDAAKRGDVKSDRPCGDQTSVELSIFWHAIHFLLTGDADPTFLRSGVQIPQVSEHCEVHSPRDVAALDARLSKTTVSELMSNFDSTKFDALELYGGRWAFPTDVSEPYTFETAQEIDRQHRQRLQELLVRFIAFVKHAAENDLGFLVVIV